MPLAVVAIGGNSLVQSNQKGTIPEQFENAVTTCARLADLIDRGWDLVLTHGNGPQVGNVLTRVEMAAGSVYTLPLDICDADTEGGMGYMLQQVLGNELVRRRQSRTVATVVTQVLVDADDPAFAKPTKPVGPFLDEATAKRRAAEQGWNVVEDAGRGWRRVVPSPKPKQIIELEAIRILVKAGVIPIAVGGGGVPVCERNGALCGIEAVIDKDRASSLLATLLGADLLLISTGVPAVEIDYKKPSARTLRRATRDQLRGHLAAGQFPAGSMGPKIEAALEYVERGGARAIITAPELMVEAIAGEAGTEIV